MTWFDLQLDLNVCILISIVPIMISSLIRSLKFIARLSAIANMCMLVGVVVILYYCSTGPSSSKTSAIAHWTTLPLYFGTSIFAFEGISLVNLVQKNLIINIYILSIFNIYTSGFTIRTRNEKSKTVFDPIRSTKCGHGNCYESYNFYRIYGVFKIWR